MALPVVDPADIAAVAAVVLREDGHAGRTYEVTGPEAVSPRAQADVIAEAIGEEVTFVELTREAAHTHMAQFMPGGGRRPAPWTSSAPRSPPNSGSAPMWRRSWAAGPPRSPAG